MDMREFIQNEYEIFCTGKLTFEFILTDSFDYLWRHDMLTVTRAEIIGAISEVIDYRRQVLRRFCRNQDTVRQTSFVPCTTEDKRKTENRIRKWLVKQLLVYRWYEQKRLNGTKKIFLELSQAV